MITFEETEAMLDEIAQELPKDFYRELNGGILLLPEEKLHPESIGGDLYVLGEYHVHHVMGRYIAMYYGSFSRAYGGLARSAFRRELHRTLVHEFTHHMESLAGERGLEKKDAHSLARYREGKAGGGGDGRGPGRERAGPQG